MHLLIVEDDVALGEALSTGLRQLGHVVDWFRDGAQADAALTSAPFDAVVLDLGLPGSDGMVWLGRWRGREISLPVLILTARDGVVGGCAAGLLLTDPAVDHIRATNEHHLVLQIAQRLGDDDQDGQVRVVSPHGWLPCARPSVFLPGCVRGCGLRAAHRARPASRAGPDRPTPHLAPSCTAGSGWGRVPCPRDAATPARHPARC
jgi:CheY-like chemotaxis protein